MDFIQLAKIFKEKKISGRYLTLDNIEPLLLSSERKNLVTVEGMSVNGLPIYLYRNGSGSKKILMWSQMHGNESTTTKAVLDLMNFLESGSEAANEFLKEFEFHIFPMLNPDGAKKYTRVNANNVDLNRDFQNLTQPESMLLRNYFQELQPDFCFNLHDQRTIFGVAETGKPATVSFLAPSYNEARDVNDVRVQAMNVIVAMNNILQKIIPGQIGRFDDGFNLNCVGDTFKSLGVPTILFEAGHFQADYERESTRKFIFIALISALQFLNENDIVANKIDDYFNIPQNKPNFYDLIYKKVKIYYDNKQIITNFALQYEEVLLNNEIQLVAKIEAVGELADSFAHFEFDADSQQYANSEGKQFEIGNAGNFTLGEKVKIVNGLPII